MRKTRVAAFAAAAAVPGLLLFGQQTPAGADHEPLAAECTAASVVTGINLLGNMPKCSTGPVHCPAESSGCSLSATLHGTTATGVGPTRCRLRIKNLDTGATVDFYASGGPTRCNIIQPTGGVAPDSRWAATCSYTRANVGVLATINCAIGVTPVGAE